MGNTQPLRIGQFTDSYPPIINGVSAFVSEHHQELLAQRQNSFVFTFGHEDSAPPEPGVYRTAGLPMGTLPFRVALTLDQPSRRVANTLDLYHVHEPFVIANVALQFAEKHARPLIYTNHTRHDTYTNNYPRAVRPPLRSLVTSTVEKAIRSSSLATAPSEDSARWMRSLVPDIAERVIVMRNGIHLKQFEAVQTPVKRESLGIAADQTIFMYIGRLTPEKNLETFAAAFSHAVANGAQAHWVLIGEGRVRAILEESLSAIRERVHFIGAIPRSQVAAHLTMADVFGTASLSEANPVSVIEAMACSRPYVGVLCDWWKEFTGESPNSEQSGGLLTAESPEALGEAIRRLAADQGLRHRLGGYSKLVSRQFDIRQVTARWIEIYYTLAAQHAQNTA